MTSGILPASLGTLASRNSTGFGNNIANPTWGQVDELYVRVTQVSYVDGLSQMEVNPSPRLISDSVLAQPRDSFGNDIDLPNAAETNEYFQFFGQFLTHDITEAASGSGENSFLDGLPFPFERTLSITDANNVRQQRTVETSFLDLSTVYGVTDAMQAMLRDDVNGVQSAKLLTSSQNTLPTFQDVANDSGLTVQQVLDENGGTTALGIFSPSLLVSGDDRTNQSAALISHQTLWMREHNYQVDRLAAQFPSWSQEQLFQAARAITEAEWQNVIYSEYLPKLLGENAISAYAGYKSNINPAVINEWATTAFRFGHDQSSNSFNTLAESGSVTGTFTLANAFQLANDSQAIRNSGQMDEWVRGQLSHQTQEIDGKIVDGNRNLLFGGATTDLNVLDIQRGRDHGVGDYNTLRSGLGLGTYASFDAFALDNKLNAATLQALKDVYNNDINQLDSVVGGLLEKHAPGSQLGLTFTVLTVMQFENLRAGDRFYFENRLAGEPGLIAEIKSTSLSDIIARNTDIDYLYHDAFAAHGRIGGTAGSETLVGSAKKDLIIGFAGDDVVLGGAGDDDLYGGDGQDVLRGDAGKDRLNGETGTDTVSYAGSSAVTIDLLFGSATGGDATGDTFTSIENLIGSSGSDLLRGEGGSNHLNGGSGNDRLYGRAGDDKLYGSKGADRLVGESGNDRLYGGTDKDTLYGGSGKDTFVFDTRPNKKTNFDKIADFNVKYDYVALDNAVFKKLGKGSETKPMKLNKKFFTLDDHAKDSNDYLFYNKANGVLYYDADGSGSGKAVEVAVLKKNLKLTYHDFLVI